MKFFIFISIFFFLEVNPIFSQKLNDLEQKTVEHQLIKGTNVALIPPKGFEVSDKVSGFQDPNDPYSMIMMMEIPGPFFKVSEGFTKETLLIRAMDLKSKKSIKIGNYQGFLVALDQASGNLNYSKHIIIFGDSTFTTMINGVYLSDSTKLGERILASLQTVFVDKEVEVSPREELDYTIDEQNTDFEFNMVMGNSIMFNYKKPHNEIISYFVDASFSKSKAKDKKAFCINRLTQYEAKYQLIVDKKVNEVVMAGMKGYELFGQSLTDKNEQIFQTIVFDEDDYYYIFCGIYPKNNFALVEEFKKMNKTFRLK